MSKTLFTERDNLSTILLSKQELHSIFEQLQESCLFRLKRALSKDSHVYQYLDFDIRFYADLDDVVYHITNTNRKKLLLALKAGDHMRIF